MQTSCLRISCHSLFITKLCVLCIVAMSMAMTTSAASVETDRTWYLAGEAMKVSVTAGETPVLPDADDAMIAYAEVCDMYGLAAGVAVSLKGGKGTGVIELPSDLHSGYYVLSAYTRHDTTVSQRLIAIVNPLRKSEDDDIEWVKITHPDSLSYAAAGNGERLSAVEGAVVKAAGVRETEGHVIYARVRNVFDGHTFSGGQVSPSLSIIGKQIHYFEGKMVNDSIAVFNTFGIHGKHPLVLSAISYTGASLPVEMISPFATLLPKQLPHLFFHYQRSEVEARSIDMQRHQRVNIPDAPLDYDNTVFGIKPDLTYNLDEYRQFLTIREVLLEYVIRVKKIKSNGISRLVVRKEQGLYDSAWPTLVLIDGMPVIDTERLLSYDARRIHYINIYDDQYTFGHGVYNGILSFVSRSGQLTNYPTETNMQYLEYNFP